MDISMGLSLLYMSSQMWFTSPMWLQTTIQGREFTWYAPKVAVVGSQNIKENRPKWHGTTQFLVEEIKNLSSDIIPASLFMIHDSSEYCKIIEL